MAAATHNTRKQRVGHVVQADHNYVYGSSSTPGFHPRTGQNVYGTLVPTGTVVSHTRVSVSAPEAQYAHCFCFVSLRFEHFHSQRSGADGVFLFPLGQRQMLPALLWRSQRCALVVLWAAVVACRAQNPPTSGSGSRRLNEVQVVGILFYPND